MSTDKDDLDYETTGHEWDGILEYNKPLPRWWLWTFYLTIVWGVLYSIAYPAWPGIRDATPGLLGFSTRANVAEAIAENEEANAAINARLVEAELTSIPENPELLQYATSAGAIPTCWTMPGSGAVISRRSTRPSPTASATRPTRTRAGRRCRPLARSSATRKSPPPPTT